MFPPGISRIDSSSLTALGSSGIVTFHFGENTPAPQILFADQLLCFRLLSQIATRERNGQEDCLSALGIALGSKLDGKFRLRCPPSTNQRVIGSEPFGRHAPDGAIRVTKALQRQALPVVFEWHKPKQLDLN